MTHHEGVLSHFLLLPELVFERGHKQGFTAYELYAHKKVLTEYCPRCASPSRTTYDRRRVLLKDHPIRDKAVYLHVTKRRLLCHRCRKPFTEPLPGVRKGHRTTERYRKGLRWAAENFTDLKRVQRHFRCSTGALYRDYYQQLELRRRRKLNYPWPEKIGIDEHSFRRHPQYGHTEFATVLVDHVNRRIYEVCEGKTIAPLFDELKLKPGAENVKDVTLDLSEGYRTLTKALFPNARLTADKFHVLRLLLPAINRRRKAVAGDRRTHSIGRQLLKSGYHLPFGTRSDIGRFLEAHYELKMLYHFKERLHRLYRCKGFDRAQRAFDQLLVDLRLHSSVPELLRLRRTLTRWKTEVLNYWLSGLTNARTEAFNNKAKLVKRRAYGYRNFQTYRLRLLDSGFH